MEERAKTEREKFLALPFVLIFTVYDIWIVEKLFAQLQIWQSISVYHKATFGFLIPVLIVFLGIGLKSKWFFVYSVVGIYCGWLDILYYLLQGKRLPSVYSWLPFSPTSFQLVSFAVISLFVVFCVDFLFEKILERIPPIII